MVGLSGGNTADSDGLKPMIGGYQTKHDPERGRNYPVGKVHADKAYDRPHLRRWLRGRRIAVRIARIGVEPSDRLGRHRWVIERTLCATRRSACIPGSAGRKSEGGFWAG